MRIFDCHCGATLFFDNVECLSCHRELGYLPDDRTLSCLVRTEDPSVWHAAGSVEAVQGHTQRLHAILDGPGLRAGVEIAARLALAHAPKLMRGLGKGGGDAPSGSDHSRVGVGESRLHVPSLITRARRQPSSPVGNISLRRAC